MCMYMHLYAKPLVEAVVVTIGSCSTPKIEPFAGTSSKRFGNQETAALLPILVWNHLLQTEDPGKPYL